MTNEVTEPQTDDELLQHVAEQDYKWGFVSAVDADTLPPGLNEDVVRFISNKKGEPQWLLDWRLKAFEHLKTMPYPKWPNVHYKQPDLNSISYYSAPKQRPVLNSLDEADPELIRTFEKLGIPLDEQKMLVGVAVDAVFDSVSVFTTFKAKLRESGVIFSSISEAVQEFPDLIREYLGSVVPYSDNFYATLNSAVFSDGSFVFVPKG
ncbi:MAG: Fe-S cluster assembly protein SufB, partial [Armatimonadota bacterium]